jgi:hypothetical protein
MQFSSEIGSILFHSKWKWTGSAKSVAPPDCGSGLEGIQDISGLAISGLENFENLTD